MALIERVQIGDGDLHNIASTAYAVCSTGGNVKAKEVTLTGFTLVTGVTIHIKFIDANGAANPTLNVNGTGAKPIVVYGTAAAGTTNETTGWQAGAILSLTYDGTSWVRDQGYNTNTTYTIKNTYSGTDTNPISGQGVKAAIDALDVTNITGFGADKTLSALSETDGKISASFQAIKIQESAVTNLITHLNEKAPIDSPVFTGSVTLPGAPTANNQAATKQYVDNSTTSLGVDNGTLMVYNSLNAAANPAAQVPSASGKLF